MKVVLFGLMLLFTGGAEALELAALHRGDLLLFGDATLGVYLGSGQEKGKEVHYYKILGQHGLYHAEPSLLAGVERCTSPTVLTFTIKLASGTVERHQGLWAGTHWQFVPDTFQVELIATRNTVSFRFEDVVAKKTAIDYCFKVD